MNIGRNIVAITVLASIKDDVYLWVSSDNERIYTKNGKIIETFGLKHDIKYLNMEDITFKDLVHLNRQLTILCCLN